MTKKCCAAARLLEGVVCLKTMQKICNIYYRAGLGIGIVAVAVMAVLVIFSVICRYFFNVTFTWTEDLVTKIYIFTTFWGIGLCIVGDEHISIDYFVNRLPQKIRTIARIVSFLIILAVLILMMKLSIQMIKTVGEQMPIGLRIKSKYLYRIMPYSIAYAIPCTIYKIIESIKDGFCGNSVSIAKMDETSEEQ